MIKGGWIIIVLALVVVFSLIFGYFFSDSLVEKDIGRSPGEALGVETGLRYDRETGELIGPEKVGWIVEIPEVPTMFDKFDEVRSLGRVRRIAVLSEHRVYLDNKIEDVRGDVSVILGSYKVRRIFKDAVLGFSIGDDISKTDRERIEELGVKLSPIYLYQTTLMDSIPLINADDVWHLNKDGGFCNPEGGITGRIIEGPDVSVGPVPCLTGRGMNVGVIDTGVDYTHPDMGGCFGQGCKVVDGYDFVNDDEDPMDDHGHGTHVTSTVAGDGVAGDGTIVKGVAPDAKITAYKVCTFSGCPTDYIIAAVERSADPNEDGDYEDHLDVISMSLSLGCGEVFSEDCGPEDLMSRAVDRVIDFGVVPVLSAGNRYHPSGPGYNPTIGSPSATERAITVAASDKDDVLASFSSGGPIIGETFGYMKPDITAPGVRICAAQFDGAWSSLECLDDEHTAISGTSMATPHVSGLVALIRQKNPSWTPEEVKFSLKNNAIDIGEETRYQGYGRVDALASVFSKKPSIARIENGGEVHGIIDITGSAYGDNFESYRLSWAGGVAEPDLDDWTVIVESDEPVIEGVLYEGFNTRLLGEEDNYVVLKLEVEDSEGLISEIRNFLIIENIKISNLEPYQEFSNEDVLEIFGRIDVENFGSYKLTAKPLVAWDSGGRTLGDEIVIIESAEQVIDGVLGSWGLSFNGEDEYYEIILEIFGPGGLTIGSLINNIYVEMVGSVHPNWPVVIDTDGTRSSFNAFNTDSDSELELFFANIFYGDSDDYLQFYGFEHDGEFLEGWPAELSILGDTQGSYSSPAIGDLNGDGLEEIVILARKSLHVFNDDGEVLFINSDNNIDGYVSPALADLTGDGNLEIIYGTFASPAPYTAGISVVKHDGSYLGPYPLEYGTGYVLGQAVGDVNGDGNVDIVFVASKGSETVRESVLYMVTGYNGEVINEISLSGVKYVEALVLGDVNNDGDLEIIFAASGEGGGDGAVYIFDKEGNLLPGWPKTDIGVSVNRYFSEIPSLGDIDNDGDLEIFFVSPRGPVYGWHHDGQEIDGWPVPTLSSQETNHQPLILDVNNDGEEDILSQSTYGNTDMIVAWDSGGNLIGGFPKQLLGETCTSYSSTTLASDIDNDGLTELVSHSENGYFCAIGSQQLKRVKVWDLDSPYTPDSVEWPMFQYDSSNTGCYKCFE